VAADGPAEAGTAPDGTSGWPRRVRAVAVLTGAGISRTPPSPTSAGRGVKSLDRPRAVGGTSIWTPCHDQRSCFCPPLSLLPTLRSAPTVGSTRRLYRGRYLRPTAVTEGDRTSLALRRLLTPIADYAKPIIAPDGPYAARREPSSGSCFRRCRTPSRLMRMLASPSAVACRSANPANPNAGTPFVRYFADR
jgi:hypothetical protein